MAITTALKVLDSNKRDITNEGRHLVHGSHFNALVDELVTLDAEDRLDALEAIVDDGTVTQATSISTGVTLDKKSGVITTVSTTLTAGASASAFTLTNSFITASSVIILSCEQGASGSCVVANASSITAGSCDITLTNGGGTSTGAATVKIHFVIL
jgi:hypothetical protein